MGEMREEGMTAAEFYAYSRRRAPSRHAAAICEKRLSGSDARAVLDVGCGAGFSARYIKRNVARDSLVAGCDIDAELLALGASGDDGEAPAAFVCNAPGSLPFADGVFDLVFSEGSMHHFDDLPGMLAESWRVLKPGGRLVVMDLNPESKLGILYVLYVRARRLMGIASKGELALESSMAEALPEAKALAAFEALGIECRTRKTLAALYYEAEKPQRNHPDE